MKFDQGWRGIEVRRLDMARGVIRFSGSEFTMQLDDERNKWMDEVQVARPKADQGSLASGSALTMSVDASTQAAKLTKPIPPIYPPLAKQGRIQGTVRFTATIATDGKVQDLKLISGHPLLAAAARDAVLKWQYQPTLVNGSPVRVVTQIDVDFSLGH
jgi:TonB family protein